MVDSRTTRRPLVIAAVMLSMAMVAIEATIVATAMPQIVGQLGGLTLYSWVFSSFLLTQTAATVVFGKLSDVYGRKPTLLAGIALFLAASLACGLAWSMPSLVVFRLLQGIGAGAIQPIAQTIVGDLYSAKERGRIQGALASVWAIAAVVGPLVGAVLVEHAGWPWIFWINLPFGAVACLLYLRFLHEDVARKDQAIDMRGAVLFTVCVGGLMVALTESGAGNRAAVMIALAAFVVGGALFALQERRSAAPLVPLAVWARRPIAAANGAALLSGMALIGLSTFLPMYVQGVLRRTPVVAGLALTVLVVGWPLGATLATRFYARYGLRPVMLAGSLFLPLGTATLLFLGTGGSPVMAGAGSLVMGIGMGLLSATSIVMIQEITAWSERGSATASNVFSRNLGSALGAALFGAVLNAGLNAGGTGTPVTSEALQGLLAAADVAGDAGALRALLADALHRTFVAMFLAALATVVAALFVPDVPLGRAAPKPAGEASAPG
jgi:MFS family permease